MGPNVVPNLLLKGSDVWALNLYRVYKGCIRGPLLRAHIKGPWNYPKSSLNYGPRLGSCWP